MSLPDYPFAAIVGQEPLRLALLLAAVDPRVGGVLIEGPRGMGKSTIARALADLLPEGRFVNLPLGATEERLTGTLNLEKVLQDGRVDFAPGLLHRADGGVLYVDEVNLLPDHLVDLLLDAAASGINVVERDGLSHQHPARFVLIGTMNPDEGELRPQLLDRFGFAVALQNHLDPDERMAIVRRRLAFDADPEGFRTDYREAQEALAHRCHQARERLKDIPLDEAAHRLVAGLCAEAAVEGVRADLVMLRAARAHAAWQGRDSIVEQDVHAVAELALWHRRKQSATPPPAVRPPPGRVQESSGDGNWGELPPRPVAEGPARDVSALLKKKA